MALQTTTNINVDFYDKKYILIKAKQYDDCSRWITIACYNQGDAFPLSNNKHNVYIRYRKADGYGVVNSCRINYRGEVLVELTEQMLAAEGMCYVDLIVVNKGSAIVNVDTGEIITIDGSEILSTMAFCINVYEAAIDNSVIESSYEFDAFNNALKKVEADYTEVIQLAKSYAMGDANDIRENENFDNSKYYYNLARSYTVGDNGMREDENIDNAEYYYQMSKSYSVGDTDINIRDNEDIDNAMYYSKLAKSFAVGDTGISERVGEDTDNAKYYNELAMANADAAKTSEINAKTSETNAKDSENAADQSEANALNYATLSQRYAKGNTNTVENENIDNAEYYYKLAKSYTVGDANGIRENEDEDNAKYYCQLSDNRATESLESANNAKTYMDNAKIYMDDAEIYMDNAQAYMNSARTSMDNALTSSNNASISEINAAASADRAKEISDSISVDVESIANNAQLASDSASSASDSAASALESYTATNDIYLQAKGIAEGFNGAFLPMGTITFAELKALNRDELKAGYLYHISDAFTTDEDFRKVGIECVIGTNVYLTADNNKWDYLINPVIVTVDEMKEYLGI